MTCRAGIGLALLVLGVLQAAACGRGGDARTDDGQRAGHDATPAGPLVWTVIENRAALDAQLSSARRAQRPVVVDVWAPWCPYCRKYDRLIEETPAIKSGFDRLVRLRIVVDEEPRDDLLAPLDIPSNVTPYMVFIDAAGKTRRDLDVTRFYAERAGDELKNRLRSLGV